LVNERGVYRLPVGLALEVPLDSKRLVALVAAAQAPVTGILNGSESCPYVLFDFVFVSHRWPVTDFGPNIIYSPKLGMLSGKHIRLGF
jgi:hypothetical protein